MNWLNEESNEWKPKAQFLKLCFSKILLLIQDIFSKILLLIQDIFSKILLLIQDIFSKILLLIQDIFNVHKYCFFII